MYLSRLILNAHHKRTRSEVERPYELHRTISKAWDDLSAARVLFRPDHDKPGVVTVIVQSCTMPDWSHLNAEKQYLRQVDGPKELALQRLSQGQRLQFRLRCNPSIRIGNKGAVDYGKRKALTTKDDIFAWLRRKADAGGFAVIDAGFDRVYWYHSKGGMQEKPLGGVVFNGVLQVTDPELFRNTIANGIGSGKAFGFGLLSVAPAD